MIYGDLDGLRAHALARGYSADLSDDAAASAALQRASDYIRFFYVERFVRTVDDQIVTDATYEAAQIEASSPGFFNRTFTPAEAKVLTEVKGIKWQIVGKNGEGAMTPTSTIINAMLEIYTSRGVGFGIRSIG